MSNGELQPAYLTSTNIAAGRPRTISAEEAQLFNKKIEVAAMRGFGVDNPTFRHVLSRVVADGRNGYKNGVPSSDAICTFQVQHSDICYKRIENQEYAELAAENYTQINTFFRTLNKI